jgi:hypothetical protein
LSGGDEALEAISDDLERLTDDARLMVELTADGRLRAPAQATREILRERLKQAEVLPTGPGWAVFRTLGPIPPPHGKPREKEIVAAGTISETGLSLIDVISFLAQSAATGAITVATPEDVERSVFFYNGDVVWAASTAPEDRLGEFLLRRGKITREQLQVAIADGARKIGRACVERGYIAAHELWSMVQAQLTEVFNKMLASESGTWFFARLSTEILSESQIHLSTQGLLVDALRRLDEMRMYRQKIRSADAVVHRIRGLAPEAEAELISKLDKGIRKSASALLTHLVKPLSIHELMRLLGTGEFEATRLVHHLLREKIVEIAQITGTGPIPRRATLSQAEAHEVINVYSMALKEMYAEMKRAGQIHALSDSVLSFLRDPDNSVSTILQHVALYPDGTIDEASLLAAATSDGIGVQEISDALSELMFFVLFQATEYLGQRKGDDLARRVKMIHGMLSPRVEAET